MKSFILFFSLFASAFTTKSFASDGIVNPAVLKSFETTFASAKEVGWSVTHDLYKAEFDLDGQHITAFYHMDGTMAAFTRNITTIQLPLNLQTTLKSEYDNYWITGLFELSNDDGVFYYVTLENADMQLVLKSENSIWNTFQKQRK